MQTLKKLKKYQIVKIHWRDVVSDNSGWARNSDYDFKSHAKAAEYESIGYYIQKDDHFIFLSMSTNIEQDISGMMLAIPLGTIKEIKIYAD